MPGDRISLVAALTRTARQHLTHGDATAAGVASSAALASIDELQECDVETDASRETRVAAWRTHADVLMAQGRFEHAIWMRHRLVRELTPPADAPGSRDGRHLLVECLEELAAAHLESGRPASAHAALRSALGHLRALASDDAPHDRAYDREYDREDDRDDERRVASELERKVAALEEALDGRRRAPVVEIGSNRPDAPPPSRMRSAMRWFGRRAR